VRINSCEQIVAPKVAVTRYAQQHDWGNEATSDGLARLASSLPPKPRVTLVFGALHHGVRLDLKNI
jgi:hypothetical protein